jgi:large subunit ribosomal protein L6
MLASSISVGRFTPWRRIVASFPNQAPVLSFSTQPVKAVAATPAPTTAATAPEPLIRKKPKHLVFAVGMKEFNMSKILLMENGLRFIVVDNKGQENYVRIPKNLTLDILENEEKVSLTVQRKKENIYHMFKKYLTQAAKGTQTSYKKKLILKGLGFKMSVEPNKIINFKLGFSHAIDLPIPEYITNAKIKKNILVLEASNKILLGNFAASIVRLKPPDTYKEKGFFYAGEKVKLRAIKKK